MNKITAVVAPVATAAMLLIGFAAPAHAGPYWNKTVKCSANDQDGRVIPTRWGNGELGWNHFSGKHNIRRCDFLNAPIGWKVDKVNGANLTYYGNAANPRYGTLKITVVVRYARKTADGRYDAGKGQVIGVITAYCNGMTKCPNWVNEPR
ncbi:hypothetical protein OG897_32345 [Streptomyces sp. NBC_00237]|uniref:hypothetical protein n=1 Tax=Streptomyces sp. NBC_00237 TaxID=2975687 RepID=UPI002257276F|nr:hypothetical protein [Streptomyces sp. NBC_00237]MCX5206090.1 hypothetical protein [Streptomyces sp. NBC_00237]